MDNIYTINICDTEIEALCRVLKGEEEQDLGWPICISFLNVLLAIQTHKQECNRYKSGDLARELQEEKEATANLTETEVLDRMLEG